jgi:hypothetical protein
MHGFLHAQPAGAHIRRQYKSTYKSTCMSTTATNANNNNNNNYDGAGGGRGARCSLWGRSVGCAEYSTGSSGAAAGDMYTRGFLIGLLHASYVLIAICVMTFYFAYSLASSKPKCCQYAEGSLMRAPSTCPPDECQ